MSKRPRADSEDREGKEKLTRANSGEAIERENPSPGRDSSSSPGVGSGSGGDTSATTHSITPTPTLAETEVDMLLGDLLGADFSFENLKKFYDDYSARGYDNFFAVIRDNLPVLDAGSISDEFLSDLHKEGYDNDFYFSCLEPVLIPYFKDPQNQPQIVRIHENFAGVADTISKMYFEATYGKTIAM